MFLTDHARLELEKRLEDLKFEFRSESANGGEGVTHQRQGAHLARVVAALCALDAGTWGVCLHCGNPIPPARLFLRPETDRCAPCMDAERTVAWVP